MLIAGINELFESGRGNRANSIVGFGSSKTANS
jgi:hypothetical protein